MTWKTVFLTLLTMFAFAGVLIIISHGKVSSSNLSEENNNLPWGVKLEVIGNHEYLITVDGHTWASGICHYEDCSYCLKNNPLK